MAQQTGTILDQIFTHKQAEVAVLKRRTALSRLRAAAEAVPPRGDFLATLRRPRGDGPALIAEIKRASPSRGLLMPHLDPRQLGRTYRNNGATALSVLTDERFFQGSLEDLHSLTSDAQIGLPVLRKDFICDPYQVYQARLAGASAVLLIVACLEASLLGDLQALVSEQGMTPLVEVHQPQELDIALRFSPPLIGINNRDLRDFSVDLDTTLRLSAAIPDQILIVAESGIHTREDVHYLQAANIAAILVGEALVTATDIPAKVRELACYG